MEKNQSKKEIRIEVKRHLSRLTDKEVKEKSHDILQRLISLEDFQKASKIFIYVAVDWEPDTKPLIERFLSEKVIYVPRCLDDHDLEAVRITSFEDLKEGKYGILEPESSSADDFQGGAGSITIVPGMAFDRQGHRLGRGKGCYDRCLKIHDRKTPIWGLCYDFQLVDSIIADDWDIAVKGIVTEKRVLQFGS